MKGKVTIKEKKKEKAAATSTKVPSSYQQEKGSKSFSTPLTNKTK